MAITKKMSFVHHGEKLIKGIECLFKVDILNNRFSDVQLKVGLTTYHAHKLVLQLNSDYFAQLSFPSGIVMLDNIEPDQFYPVLQFIYTGEIILSEKNVESVLNTAELLRMEDLKKLCFAFIADNLTENEPVQCWKLAVTHHEPVFAQRFKEMVVSNIKNLDLDSSLVKLSEEMMREVLSDNNLNVSSEVQACEMFMKWLHLQTGRKIEVHHEELLPLIRWSGISVNYTKCKLLQNTQLTSKEVCMAFLCKVINYHVTTIQFEGLQTFQRISTGIENCAIVFGLDDGPKMSQQVHRISLEQPSCVTEMIKIPTFMQMESQACAHGSNVYLTGIGCCRNEAWRFDTLSATWFKCTDMITGRSKHCAVIVDSQLHLLGGRLDDDSRVLCSIECYNIVANKWFSAGNLIHATQNSACVTYKNNIHVFGGMGSDYKEVAHVQVYNPATETCTLLDSPMPAANSLMRAVLWETSVILMCDDTCLLYNFETKTWQEREQFKADANYFGLILDNESLYIVGGGYVLDENTEETFTCSDGIRSVSVMDIIEDKPVRWWHHAKLAKPAFIHAYCLVALSGKYH